MIRRAAWVAVCALALVPGTAAAQDGRVEVRAGGGWLGSIPVGARPATLTGPTGLPFTLFSTETALGAAPHAVMAIGVGVASFVDIEVRGSYGRPKLTTRIADDAEGIGAVAVSETVHEFLVAAVAVVHPSAWRVGPRTGLFVSGGAGYMRHLHAGNGYAEGGRVYLAGGGAAVRLGGGGRLKAIGVRVDGGVAVRTGAAVLDHSTDASPLAGASLYLRF